MIFTTYYELLISKIFAAAKKQPLSPEIYEDCFSAIRDCEAEDFSLAHESNKKLRAEVVKNMPRASLPERFFSLYKKTLLFDAPYRFDEYLQYLEIDRRPQDRFYLPRRRVLKNVTDALQDLADDKLDELFLSEPPRVGKSTMLLFYMTWVLGRDSEKANLYSAYSDVITKAFYNGVLEVLTDPYTYKWRDVFPDSKIVQTNSQDETINIDRRKRYPSLTCRSLYGTLNGACDCNGILISDDLIGGIEEALNKDRLLAAWSKVENNLLPRAKEEAKILWCGTRWSMLDPAGLRMDLLLNDERYKDRRFRIINLPALDENDESNFAYEYGVGFSTEYYRQRRASFERNNDMASWAAQYMGEPIEREGALFSPEDFRYYNGELPEGDPDRVFMAVDPAYGGGDFVAAPVCYMYGDDIYVVDVVYNDGDKTVTQPLIVDAVKRYGVAALQVEANKATEGYKDDVEAALRAKGLRLNITTKNAPNNKSKEVRIFDIAPDIRERMIFRESGKRSKAYELFMQNVFSFKITGKNKHDDAPDSLAMAIDMITQPSRKAVVFHRPF